MFLDKELKKIGKKNIRVYLDMDGTIVHYEVGNADNYDIKRPLLNRINNVKKIISEYDNISFYILSIGHEQKHIDQKNKWLDKYLPEIPKENRAILIRNIRGNKPSPEIKRDFINSIKTDDIIVLIDDDPRIIDAVRKNNKNNVILYKDSVLSD
ncbi:MAG: hypothetical protein K5666_00035 [Bacilli bacterium]|nr:hypothetical protein [Bacilli bacterium]